MTRFFVMFQGKELGWIEAKTYKEAKENIEDVITIEEEENEG